MYIDVGFTVALSFNIVKYLKFMSEPGEATVMGEHTNR